MNSVEIIIGCIFGAYLIMKIREYIKAARLIKQSTINPQEVIDDYHTQLATIKNQIATVQTQQQDLTDQPISHKVKRQIKHFDKQLSQLDQKQKGVENALADYQKIINELTEKSDIKQNLRSYLHNKYHL